MRKDGWTQLNLTAMPIGGAHSQLLSFFAEIASNQVSPAQLHAQATHAYSRGDTLLSDISLSMALDLFCTQRIKTANSVSGSAVNRTVVQKKAIAFCFSPSLQTAHARLSVGENMSNSKKVRCIRGIPANK